MGEDSHEWRATVLMRFATHLATALAPLLPDGVQLVSTASEVILVDPRRAAASRPCASRPITVPADPAATAFETSAWELFADVQDLVVEGVGRGWPFNDVGTAVHPWVSRSADTLLLGFRGRGRNADTPGIDLPPFVLPEPPSATRLAG